MEADGSLSCQTFPLTFIKMGFNIIPSSACAFSKWPSSFRFPHQNPVCISLRYVETGAGNHPASSIGAGDSLPKAKRLDSSVGIAPRYALDGPGPIPSGGARFSAHVQTGPGAHQACTLVTGVSFSGLALTTHPLSSAEVKERVELYLYSLSRPSWTVRG